MNNRPGIFLILMVYSAITLAEPITFSSSKEQTLLIELYSSEGCSSCPPADHFISQFKSSPDLWTKYIPLVFHVDYWDYLGWQDVFAHAEYSNRQRTNKQQANISSVYTPGFVVNGEEWTGFFKVLRTLPETTAQPGSLSVTIDRHLATVSFTQAQSELTYHLAILGMKLETQIKAGENKGHLLTHDFVVLNHQSLTGTGRVTFELPLIVKHRPKQLAMVAWVSEQDSLKPIQAVGNFLPDNTIKVL